MGFNLYIGEFAYEVVSKERHVSVGVRPEGDIGPLNSSDRLDNQCWPSYIAWHKFCVDVGLLEVFYGGKRSGSPATVPALFDAGPGHGEIGGLLSRHPGCAPLLPAHFKAFVNAKIRYMARPSEEQEEYVQRRLVWLCWWADWALGECDYPSFANS